MALPLRYELEFEYMMQALTGPTRDGGWRERGQRAGKNAHSVARLKFGDSAA